MNGFNRYPRRWRYCRCTPKKNQKSEPAIIAISDSDDSGVPISKRTRRWIGSNACRSNWQNNQIWHANPTPSDSPPNFADDVVVLAVDGDLAEASVPVSVTDRRTEAHAPSVRRVEHRHI